MALPVFSEDLLAAFPALACLEPSISSRFLQASRLIKLDRGSLVFEAGQDCEQYFLIQDGTVRVHLLDADGHEIVLYRLGRGETCILTTAALLGSTPYVAYAVVETAAVATVISLAVFEALIAQSSAFRRLVFASHAGRIIDLMQVISDVAFTRVRVRLARCLLQRADTQGRVEMTHDSIAIEIGTAREVISRNLKSLEQHGCVRLGQGTLIIDSKKLARFAEGESS